jgi:hypothetical protein
MAKDRPFSWQLNLRMMLCPGYPSSLLLWAISILFVGVDDAMRLGNTLVQIDDHYCC